MRFREALVGVLALPVLAVVGCGGSAAPLDGTIGSLLIERSDGAVYSIALPSGDETRVGSIGRFWGGRGRATERRWSPTASTGRSS
jgi:hypothetical protein